jgi:hypothetical protein
MQVLWTNILYSKISWGIYLPHLCGGVVWSLPVFAEIATLFTVANRCKPMFMKFSSHRVSTVPAYFKLIFSLFFLSLFLRTNAQSGGTPNTWQYVTSANGSVPQGRHECAYVEMNGKLYLIGGRGTPDMSIYNPATNTWTTGPKFPNNKEIHHFQAVKFNNKIYVIGSFTGGFPTETPVADIYVFDPVTNAWSTLSVQVPVGRRRGSVGVAVYNNKIYLVGGIINGHTDGWVNWMDEFDPVTLTFKTMPNAPHQRDHFHAVVFGDKLYVTGGRKSSYPQSTIGFTDPTVDVFDFISQTWATLPPSSNIPTPRAGTATVLLNNEIVLASGESGTNSYHREVEAFNPLTGTWRSLPPMITGRNAPGGEVYNNRFYVVTGVNSNVEVTTQEVYFTNPSPIVNSPIADLVVVKNTISSQINLANVFADDEGTANLSFSITGNTSPQLITSATVTQSAILLNYAADQTGSGNIRIRATDSDGFYVEDEFKVDVIETPPPVSIVKLINSGGSTVNFSGQTWAADVNFSGGSTYSNTTAIAATTNDAIYQTERFGNTFSYSIPLANGTYNVKLHFAELYFTSSNQRVFNVNIENGKGVLTNYDIFSKAGAKTAKVEEFPSIVLSDGTLNINFSSVTNNAKISAIEISSVIATCNAPASGNASGITSKSAVLNWNAASGASSYRVEYKKSSESNWTLAATGITALTTTIAGLDPGITYNWRVQAVCTTTGSSFFQSQFTTLLPVANAGNDQSINNTSTTLAGSGSVTNGTITSYSWAQVSGPNTAVFNSSTVQQPVISSLIPGNYVFSLVVKDNAGGESIADNVTITVAALPVNKIPVADAGSNINITLPTATANLSGSGNDEDGSISGYEWTQSSGPNTAVFSGTTIANPQVSGLIQGTYIFSLIVKDNELAESVADQVTVTVNAAIPVNKIPVADAGSNINITLPTATANLSGSGNDEDGSISGYEWTQSSGPNTAVFSGTTIANPQVSGLIQGTYIFSLIVKDNELAESVADQVTVTVNAAIPVNKIPVADAGSNINITLPTATANLSGSGSDEDGSISEYEWTQSSGPNTAAFSSTTIANPQVSGLIQGTYIFSLIVKDNELAESVADQVTVTVNAAVPVNKIPVADAGSNINITLPTATANLSGSGSDEDGSISGYEWTQSSGPNTAVFSSTTIANPQVSGLIQGTYIFSLIVKDNELAASVADQVTVTVNAAVPVNKIPVADAGSNINITLPTATANLSGSGSDEDGSISGYVWTQSSGPNTAVFSSTTIANPQVSGLIQGTYIFSLIVKDNELAASVADQVTVTVNAAVPVNKIPVANAGSNINITLPTATANLSGSGSDEDGSISEYEWTQSSGPNTAVFSGTTIANPQVSGLIQGTYIFSLIVKDNELAESVADQVTVTVNAAIPVNKIPVADAGSNINITLPTATANLSGSGSDEDGSISGYEWTQSSGPNTAVFSGKTIANPQVSGLIQGTYIFSLIVKDNELAASVADQVTVTVNAAVPVNKIPVADAGSNINITLPTATANLSGSGSDEDGSISGYVWTQTSGPNTAAFSSTTIANPQVSGLIQGTYIFSLIVKDNELAASVADQVTVTVNAAVPVNKIPVADAGSNINITLPTATANLSGSGSDEDGSISGYVWTQTSGPNTAAFSNTTIANPQVSGLIQGTYIFSLIVKDNALASSIADQVSVIVAPAPVAYSKYINAGGSAVTFNGQNWLADQNFSGGSSYSTTNPIGLTTNDAVYQKERYGKTFNYAIPVPNGTYTLRLHFAEIYWSSAGQRVFNINVESGKAILNNFDIYAKAGLNNAYVEQIEPLSITDGTLNIAFTTVTDNAKISGIEIVTYNGVIPCGIPAGLSTSNVTSASAIVSWNAVPGAANYKVEYKIASQPGWTVATPATTQTSFALTNLSSNTLYDWRVQATCINGTGNNVSGQFTTIIPVANAGTDKAITLPQSSVQLTGSGSVAAGSIVTYAWIQVSGPNTASFNSTSIAQPTVSGLVAGNYIFSLTVTDNQNKNSIADQVTVVVSSSVPPVANAGADKSIILPTSSTTLNGSGTASSGIKAYTWSQVSGPGTATFSSKTVAVPTVSALVSGTYVFALTITDNNDVVSLADQVNVVVSASVPPVANAGADKSITLPTSSTTLNGSGTASSGIKAYTWSQVSGPGTATFSSKTVAVPTVSALVSGTYVFALTITDNNDVVSVADQVNVIVSPAANGQQVVSLTLVNASNESDIFNLTNGVVVNLATIGTSLNIRANTSPSTVGRVVFVMTGTQSRNITETVAPYALFGDNNGNYNPWTPAIGQYTLTATPYTTSGGGVAGTPLTITFTVVSQAARTIQTDSNNLRGIQNPSGMTLMQNQPLLTALPNPSGNQFNVQFISPDRAAAEMIMMNVSGQIVERKTGIIPGEIIQIGSLYKPGIYIVRVIQKNQIRTLKIIKQ